SVLFSCDDTYAGHFRRYSRQSANALLRASGFEPLRATYFMAPLIMPVFLLRTLPSRLGFRPRLDYQRHERDHGRGSPFKSILRAVLATEARHLARGRQIPVGTSCLALARVRPD